MGGSPGRFMTEPERPIAATMLADPRSIASMSEADLLQAFQMYGFTTPAAPTPITLTVKVPLPVIPGVGVTYVNDNVIFTEYKP